MLSDKSNLNLSIAAMSISRSYENKENMSNLAVNQPSQTVLSNALKHHSHIEHIETMNDPQEGMEPLDYRHDWSQEIMYTFGTLPSSSYLEKVLIR